MLSSIAISPSFKFDKTVFISSKGDGIYKSQDQGSSWFKVNKGLGNLNIRLLAVSSDYHSDKIVLAAGTEGGMNRSENGGRSWCQVIDDDIKVTAIGFFSGPKKNHILVGDHKGILYCSTDTGTDSDGTIFSYAWSQIGVPAVTISNADTAHATFTAPEVTEETFLTFRLTVTDNKGAEASDGVTITVNPANEPPIADAGFDQFVVGGTEVTLNGMDSEGAIASYAWSQVEGDRVTITNIDTAIATFTAPDVTDPLTFRLSVTDDEGATASDDVTVSVAEVFVFDDFEDGNDNDWIKFDDTANGFSWEVINGEYVQQNYVASISGGTPFVES